MTQGSAPRPAPYAPPIRLSGPEATTAIARWLAPQLAAGDTLLLVGPIGAGKTHFARALIEERLAAAGALPEDIPSPTFTLVQSYRAGKLEIWHADLYRLTSSDEVAELGLEEAFESSLCLVEWPERLGALAPTDALTLHFAMAERGAARTLEPYAGSARARELAEILYLWPGNDG